MPPLTPGLPHWAIESAYAPLLEVEKAGLAWEWLRRDPDYRAAALDAIARRKPRSVLREEAAAASFGLHAFEDPGLNARSARPVWRAARHNLVLEAWAEPSKDPANALDLEGLPGQATLVLGEQAEHLLLSDGCRSIRLDATGASLVSGPVRLHYRLNGLGDASAPLVVLRRLLALARTGQFSRALHPPEARLRRLVGILRAADALKAGASQREIAAVLLGAEAARPRWRIRSPSTRSRAQRLARSSAAMAAGGWHELLV
jgi:hypothetical protein